MAAGGWHGSQLQRLPATELQACMQHIQLPLHADPSSVRQEGTGDLTCAFAQHIQHQGNQQGSHSHSPAASTVPGALLVPLVLRFLSESSSAVEVRSGQVTHQWYCCAGEVAGSPDLEC